MTPSRKPLVISSILIVLGIYLLASAGYDEFRGSTTTPAMHTDKHHNTAYLRSLPLLKKNEPELFRQFMVTHWIYASLVEITGCTLYLKSKKQGAL
jgi:hypothetical protein